MEGFTAADPAAASPALVATSLVLVAATLAQNLALAVCVSVASSRHTALTLHADLVRGIKLEPKNDQLSMIS